MLGLDGDLVGGFYEAAATPALWPDAWNRLLAAFGADSALVWRQAGLSDAPLYVVTDWPPVAMRAFADGQAHLDPIALPGALAQRFGALLGRRVPCGRAFGAGETYAAFARRYVGGAWHVATAGFVFEDFATCGIGLHRPREAAAFTAAEQAALDRLARHLGAALRLERTLIEGRIAQSARDTALDQVAQGMVIADGDGRVLFANRAARALADGGLIRGGGLAAGDRVAALVRAAAQGKPGGIVRLPAGSTSSPGLAASVTPVGARLGLEGAGLVLINLRALAPAPDVSAEQLIALFDLTPAEASIVPQLLAGDTALAIAQSRGVKPATVRDQSARILAKTGAANLRALATMVASLV